MCSSLSNSFGRLHTDVLTDRVLKGEVLRFILENLLYLILLKLILNLSFFVFRSHALSLTIQTARFSFSVLFASVLYYLLWGSIHWWIGWRIGRTGQRAFFTISAVSLPYFLLFGWMGYTLSPVWPFSLIEYVMAASFLFTISLLSTHRMLRRCMS